MGASLYLSSIFRKNRANYAAKCNYWVAKRDALHNAGKKKAAAEAHQKVAKYYNKMCERGYFRDSYDSSNLLWLFDLSWWEDVLHVLTSKDGRMSPRNAKRFLEMLDDREPVLEANLKKVKLSKGETREIVEQYYKDKYKRLRAFLREAISRNECIECSL